MLIMKTAQMLKMTMMTSKSEHTNSYHGFCLLLTLPVVGVRQEDYAQQLLLLEHMNVERLEGIDRG